MNRRATTQAVVLIVVFFGAFVSVAPAQESERRPPIKVMSFNIRYGTASDGHNSWNFRQHLVEDTIRLYGPDLLGTQETLKFQADWIREKFPEYGFHGVGRDDGKEAGEYCAIFYRKDRFEVINSGHMWLSETPDVPGSKSWDAALPRMLSWVALRDMDDPTQPAMVFSNTHFDHRGREARLKSAELIRSRFEQMPEDAPVIIVGDFNTTSRRAPYACLVCEGEDTRPLVDSYIAIHPEASKNEATFSAWRNRREGERIDWVLHSRHFNTLNAGIDYTQEDDRNPSDHYPVWANLRLRGPSDQ